MITLFPVTIYIFWLDIIPSNGSDDQYKHYRAISLQLKSFVYNWKALLLLFIYFIFIW